MPYQLEIERQAGKELARLPRPVQQRISKAINDLADNPRPSGCMPVKNAPKGTYRIRIGDYRVVYLVLDDRMVIVVVRVARRNEQTYRDLE